MLSNFSEVKLTNVFTKQILGAGGVFFVVFGGFILLIFGCFVGFFLIHCILYYSFKRRSVAEIKSYCGINNRFFGFSMVLELNKGRQNVC